MDVWEPSLHGAVWGYRIMKVSTRMLSLKGGAGLGEEVVKSGGAQPHYLESNFFPSSNVPL
jgi:hypothetical protein